MRFRQSFLAFALVAVTLTFSQASLELSPAYALGVSSDWAKPAISEMNDAGLIPNSLVNDKDYKESVTREEFTELITTYYSKVDKQSSFPTEKKFSDTNNPLILLASKLGIVGGYPDGSFKPSKNITRQEIAVMANQAEKQLTGISQTSNVSNFKDGKQIASWAKESVGSLYTAGGIGGYPDGTFKPTNNMSKQEAISLVSNLADKAGLIDKGAAVVPPIVVGQTVEQAQALYTQTMGQYPVVSGGGVASVNLVKSFRVVEAGAPFVVNGITITGINMIDDNGARVSITQSSEGKAVSDGASFYASIKGQGIWVSVQRNSKGIWWVDGIKAEEIKAVMFGDGNYNMTLVKLR